jgi:hypothetical protein
VLCDEYVGLASKDSTASLSNRPKIHHDSVE